MLRPLWLLGPVPASKCSIAVTIGDCISAYRPRPNELHLFDVQRLDEFDATIGSRHVSKVREAWGAGPSPK